MTHPDTPDTHVEPILTAYTELTVTRSSNDDTEAEGRQ